MTRRRWLAVGQLLILTWAALLIVLPTPAAEKVNAKASEDRLRQDIFFLASPACEGRGVTTKGINLAADHIASEFKKAGLQPGGKDGSYFQPFAIAGSVLESCGPLLLHGRNGQIIELKPGLHFHPFGMAGSGKEAAPLVFAGYGITSKEPAYDDYDGLDAEGKVVVVLRDTPRTLNKQAVPGNWRRRHGSFHEKMLNAERHKAVGILFVNDWETAQTGDDLVDFNYLAAASSQSKLPAFHLSRSVLEDMLRASRGLSLRELEEDTDRLLKPHSTALDGWTVDFDLKVKRSTTAIPVKNVVGVLEGRGKLANETVIIGAHYDHVGYGGQSSLANSKKMAIHFGADDNASGSTSILELARRFAALPNREGRRLVFIAFSGEELGLLGSVFYCKEPLFPLADTVAMVNLDMVGRLRPDPDTGKDLLQVHGTGTAKTFDALIDELNKKYDFKLQKQKGGFGPSDHSSFYSKKIPVFFFFTGDHPQYHRPTDTPDLINVPGMRKVVDLAEDLVARLMTDPERPEYVPVTSSGGPRADGPRLGIMPDYNDDKEGLLIRGVSEGFPAQKAGLKENDRIMQLNGKPVKNVTGYMQLMSTHKRGDTIEVEILRDGKPMKVKVKLD
jgi:hypothetical protein